MDRGAFKFFRLILLSQKPNLFGAENGRRNTLRIARVWMLESSLLDLEIGKIGRLIISNQGILINLKGIRFFLLESILLLLQ